jgi:hypothetical protein
MHSGHIYYIYYWENETSLGATSQADLLSKINAIVNECTGSGGYTE